MARVINPFAGVKVGFTWAQHKAAGYQGGTDYIVGPGVPVRAACAGYAWFTFGAQSEINIQLNRDTYITTRELARPIGHFPRTVRIDEVIGITSVKWPHIDRTTRGVRRPFESIVNYPNLIIAGVGKIIKLLTPEEESDVEYIYIPEVKVKGVVTEPTRYYTVVGYVATQLEPGEHTSVTKVQGKPKKATDYYLHILGRLAAATKV